MVQRAFNDADSHASYGSSDNVVALSANAEPVSADYVTAQGLLAKSTTTKASGGTHCVVNKNNSGDGAGGAIAESHIAEFGAFDPSEYMDNVGFTSSSDLPTENIYQGMRTNSTPNVTANGVEPALHVIAQFEATVGAPNGSAASRRNSHPNRVGDVSVNGDSFVKPSSQLPDFITIGSGDTSFTMPKILPSDRAAAERAYASAIDTIEVLQDSNQRAHDTIHFNHQMFNSALEGLTPRKRRFDRARGDDLEETDSGSEHEDDDRDTTGQSEGSISSEFEIDGNADTGYDETETAMDKSGPSSGTPSGSPSGSPSDVAVKIAAEVTVPNPSENMNLVGSSELPTENVYQGMRTNSTPNITANGVEPRRNNHPNRAGDVSVNGASFVKPLSQLPNVIRIGSGDTSFTMPKILPSDRAAAERAYASAIDTIEVLQDSNQRAHDTIHFNHQMFNSALEGLTPRKRRFDRARGDDLEETDSGSEHEDDDRDTTGQSEGSISSEFEIDGNADTGYDETETAMDKSGPSSGTPSGSPSGSPSDVAVKIAAEVTVPNPSENMNLVGSSKLPTKNIYQGMRTNSTPNVTANGVEPALHGIAQFEATVGAPNGSAASRRNNHPIRAGDVSVNGDSFVKTSSQLPNVIRIGSGDTSFTMPKILPSDRAAAERAYASAIDTIEVLQDSNRRAHDTIHFNHQMFNSALEGLTPRKGRLVRVRGDDLEETDSGSEHEDDDRDTTGQSEGSISSEFEIDGNADTGYDETETAMDKSGPSSGTPSGSPSGSPSAKKTRFH